MKTPFFLGKTTALDEGNHLIIQSRLVHKYHKTCASYTFYSITGLSLTHCSCSYSPDSYSTTFTVVLFNTLRIIPLVHSSPILLKCTTTRNGVATANCNGHLSLCNRYFFRGRKYSPVCPRVCLNVMQESALKYFGNLEENDRDFMSMFMGSL